MIRKANPIFSFRSIGISDWTSVADDVDSAVRSIAEHTVAQNPPAELQQVAHPRHCHFDPGE